MSVHQHDDIENMDINCIIDAVSQGATLKELSGISDGEMEGLYSLAYDFYKQGRLDEAEKFFRFLCIYDFYNVDFILGLAAVYQMKKMYEKAIDIYALAFAQGKSDYRSMLYAGQCQLSIGRVGKAKKCFLEVVKSSNDEFLRNKAEAYLTALKLKKDS